MSSKIQSVALLLPAFVLVTGLASAQPGVKVSTVNTNTGSVTTTTINNSTEINGTGTTGTNGPTSKAPAVDSAGRAKYWDGTSSTDFYNRPPYISAPPNPQVAVGPDDILTIVNRTISRYPNPNAGTNTGVANPYNNPPTEQVWLDVWLGLTILSPQGGAGALCPSGTGSNSICVIDNASIRYDQLQGRYVVLFTVTDMQAHRSNFVLVVSKSSQFQNCANTPATCVGGAASSPFFTAPAIAPIVGGTGTGGANTSNWIMYTIPINLAYNPTGQPGTLGLINAAGTQENVVGTPNAIVTAGTAATFLTSQFCTNGGPAVQNNGVPNFALARTCTNYFPTGARMGLDNDNIILTAPVLDQAFNFLEGQLAFTPGQAMGPYSGTRVVSVSKLVAYNGTSFVATQPPTCIIDNPSDCSFVNLSDNTATGTLTAVNFNFPNINCTTAAPAIVAAVPPANNPVSACGPVRTPNGGTFNPLPRVFWEPDNLRGRALASFDAQVPPFGNPTAGVITPIDYLVGTQISSTYGAINTNIGSTFFIQPIVFSCPGNAIFPGPAGVAFCGSTSASQVSDLPLFGALKTNVHTLGAVGDPAPVGQGIGPTTMTANDGSSTTNKRLYVGDSRPQQVIFREGLLYSARNVRQSDFFTTSPLGTSTVLYDIIKSCANAAPLPNCGTFSINGAGIGNPTLTLETEWFNGQNVPDPGGDINGFGFYQPMFEVPADVISSGPVSPINLLPWFDKLFVGMTTGGTSNVAAIFSKNLPSLWDFRPGDDAYDTALPYLDPYFGNIVTNVNCASDLATTGSVVSGTKAVTVADTTGLSVGMFVSSISLNGAQIGVTAVSVPSNPPTTIASIVGNVVTLSANVTVTSNNQPNPITGANVSITFSRTAPNTTITLPATQITQGSNVITLSSVTGLVIGATLNVAGGANVQNQTTTNNPAAPTIGPFPGATTIASTAVTLAAANPAIVVGMPVTGPTAIAPNTTVAAISGSNLTLSVAAIATAAAEPLTFTTLIAGATGATSFTVNSITNVLPGAAVNGGFVTLTSTTTNTSPVVTIPAGSSIAVGEAVSGPGIPANTTVVSFVGQNVTLSANATASSTTAALNFGATSATASATIVNGSNVITIPAAVPVGATVSGTGIPNGTIVTSSTATSATLSNNATASGTNTLTFVTGSAFAPGTTVVSASTTNTPTGTINSVTIIPGLAAVLASGRTVTFVNANNGSSLFFPGGALVVNIQNTGTAASPINTVTLNTNAAATLPAGQTAQLSFLVNSSVFQVCPMIPFSTRGGASTDPNDGSLWLYGEFAKNRLSTVPGPGEWGTSVANYPLSFPATDPYGNDNTYFQDVQPTGSPASGFFTWIQIAKNLGIAVPAQTGPCTINNGVAPVQPPPQPGTTPVPNPNPGSNGLLCPYFLPDFVVTRAEMAYWVVRSQMDEAQVTQYLCATGGDPTQGCPGVSSTAASASSFSDTGSFIDPFIATPTLGFPGVTPAQLQRYIEVMYRRGYTKGCGGTDDPQRRYCPDLPVKRQEMAVFLIRAKMNNVFPTSLSGIPVTGPYGDNFGAFNQTAQYFSDVSKAAGDPAADYFIYIQKMRELRITNGTAASLFSPANPLTRKEIATFVIRAFFL